jgi:hypothetical protein
MRLQRVALQVEDVGKAADFLEKLWGSPQPAPRGVLASSAAPPAQRRLRASGQRVGRIVKAHYLNLLEILATIWPECVLR